MSKKAIVVGATGLIGSNLVNILAESAEYEMVLLLVRNVLPLTNRKILQEVIDFDELKSHILLISGDVLFCCLGSTKSKTPDMAAYRKVDHDYPLELAGIALQNQIPQFHLVSAIGAKASSSNFYTKMKGEIENDLKKVGLKCLQIYQPSLLTGDRKEPRLAEKILTAAMKLLNPLLIGSLKDYRSIAARTVAMAMYKQSLTNKAGVFTYTSEQIKQLA